MALQTCSGYTMDLLQERVQQCCRALNLNFRPGERVLVKPNLVSARRATLSCTHPALVLAVCQYLVDCQAHVLVGDSPSFGSARQVAEACGLLDALRVRNIPVLTLDQPVRRLLECGISVGIDRTALETDQIFNLPKFKAHGQLFATAAVKNLFGCVSGIRKALAHMQYDQGDRLAEMIIDLIRHLPPVTSLADAVTAMQQTGPIAGTACNLHLIGASTSPVALDTALYALLGFAPEKVPLWRVARRKELAGCFAAHISYPLLDPSEIVLPAFESPQTLNPVSFRPWRLAMSMCKRAWLRIHLLKPGAGKS